MAAAHAARAASPGRDHVLSTGVPLLVVQQRLAHASPSGLRASWRVATTPPPSASPDWSLTRVTKLWSRPRHPPRSLRPHRGSAAFADKLSQPAIAQCCIVWYSLRRTYVENAPNATGEVSCSVLVPGRMVGVCVQSVYKFGVPDSHQDVETARPVRREPPEHGVDCKGVERVETPPERLFTLKVSRRDLLQWLAACVNGDAARLTGQCEWASGFTVTWRDLPGGWRVLSVVGISDGGISIPLVLLGIMPPGDDGSLVVSVACLDPGLTGYLDDLVTCACDALGAEVLDAAAIRDNVSEGLRSPSARQTSALDPTFVLAAYDRLYRALETYCRGHVAVYSETLDALYTSLRRWLLDRLQGNPCFAAVSLSEIEEILPNSLADYWDVAMCSLWEEGIQEQLLRTRGVLLNACHDARVPPANGAVEWTFIKNGYDAAIDQYEEEKRALTKHEMARWGVDQLPGSSEADEEGTEQRQDSASLPATPSVAEHPFSVILPTTPEAFARVLHRQFATYAGRCLAEVGDRYWEVSAVTQSTYDGAEVVEFRARCCSKDDDGRPTRQWMPDSEPLAVSVEALPLDPLRTEVVETAYWLGPVRKNAVAPTWPLLIDVAWTIEDKWPGCGLESRFAEEFADLAVNEAFGAVPSHRPTISATSPAAALESLLATLLLTNDERNVARLWHAGKTAKEIWVETSLASGTIYNKVSRWRRTIPQLAPYLPARVSRNS